MTPEEFKASRMVVKEAEGKCSQADFGALIGINSRNVRRIEAGDHTPSPPVVLLIERVLKDARAKMELFSSGQERDNRKKGE